jgi:hypothetical protein
MDNATTRKQRLREKRKAEGMKAYEVWLDTDGQTRLATLRQAGESVDAVIGRALAALEHLASPVSSHEAESVPSHETMPVADRPADPAPPTMLTPQARKVALVRQVQQLQAEGMSLRAMARQLNAAGVPTISGRGTWQAGTIGNLLAEPHP